MFGGFLSVLLLDSAEVNIISYLVDFLTFNALLIICQLVMLPASQA